MLITTATVALVGCASLGGPPTELRNLEWRAVDVGGLAAITTHRPASMRLDAHGRAGGSGGCNQWHAQYRIDGSKISFSQIGSTRMLCEGPAGDQESVFFDILQSVDRYTVSQDGALTLATPHGWTIIFRYAGKAGN